MILNEILNLRPAGKIILDNQEIGGLTDFCNVQVHSYAVNALVNG